MKAPAVAVAVVTHDSERDLPGCLEAALALEHRPLELVIVDCASSDASVAVARRAAAGEVPVRVIELGDNAGFAGGMNEAIRQSRAPFLLSLNPDARPAVDYVGLLLSGMVHRGWRVGAVTGRLRRPRDGGPPLLDACGMRLTRSWRHLDRGSGEVDRGQLAEPERVFGATGAATLFLREALDDASVDGEVFDAAFHSYREDAELCFRLRERGWEVIYEPQAVAEHRRRVLPERRARLPAAINRHSLKNRYLLRAYHQTGGNAVRTLVPATGRDLLALAYVLTRERTSLPAYRWLWRHRSRIWARRRRIQARRTRPPEEIDRWFRRQALPL